MANITKRLTVGRPLTNAEVDNNFENLNAQKLEKDGSTVMTGNLQTPGVDSTSAQNGLRFYNESGQLVATLGAGNSKDLVIEGNIDVGGAGGSNINLNGGDIEAKNIYLTGRIISSELNGQFNVANVGDVYTGVASADTGDGKLRVTIDTIVKLVNKAGTFAVGQTVTGVTSQTAGVITKVIGGTVLHVRLTNATQTFTTGERIEQSGSGGSINGTASEIINTSQLNDGHRLKIFGVSAPAATPVDAAEAGTLTKVGSLGGTQSTYHYWITQFRMDNGQISAARKLSGSVQHGAVGLFNAENHITLTLARTNSTYGIAVYRATANDITEARLVEVLGPEQLGSSTANITYIDYGTYSNTEWSTKDANGTFTAESGIVHFPVSPNSTSRLGWETLEVSSVINASVVKMTTAANFNAGGAVELVHDNTIGLQNAINANRDLSLRNIVLPNGVYYTSRLDVPNDFVVLGSGKLTVIKQLPWNFNNFNDVAFPANKGNIFKAQSTEPQNIYFRDLAIDGNLVNSVRFEEVQSNYVIAIPNAYNINVDNTIIRDVPGGGVYAYNSDTVRVQDSEIVNGSLSYRGNDLCPIYAGQSRRLTITGNSCENFVSPLDVSVANIGVVVGNTIRNCGSGLLIYGSGNLLSSPNLLMGPDNEFLPSPDTQDSDFNSVNISINPGVDYISPSYLFLSRGDTVHLGSTNKTDVNSNIIPGTAVELTSDIFVLTKLNNTEIPRTAWDYSLNNGNPIINIITPDTGDYGRNNGYFQFRVTQANASAVPNLATLLATHGSALAAGEQLVGLVYRIKAKAYTYTDPGERLEVLAGAFSTSGSDKFYTITLSNVNDFPIFTVGDKVKVFGHSSTPDINNVEATIAQKIEDGLLRKIRIQLPAGTDLTNFSNGGNTGYITIQNTFIIAKGRIL
jgi:hypothetical protein